MQITIRPANPGDAERIAAIYNEGIADRRRRSRRGRGARPRSRGGRSGRCRCSSPRSTGQVAGFAKVGPYSEREVYAGIGEHAVYVAGDARRLGVGHALLEALAGAAEQAGLYKLTSRIFTTNTASIALHEASGSRSSASSAATAGSTASGGTAVLVERLLGDAAGSAVGFWWRPVRGVGGGRGVLVGWRRRSVSRGWPSAAVAGVAGPGASGVGGGDLRRGGCGRGSAIGSR